MRKINCLHNLVLLIGLIIFFPLYVPAQQKSSTSFYEQDCEAGDTDACLLLGVMYYKGDGVPVDKAKALYLYQKACDGGDDGACSNIGLMYDNGDGVPVNKTKAFFLYQKACDGGSTAACSNLGIMYLKGDGVPVDKVKAFNIFQVLCDGGIAGACSNLGFMYDNGDGVPMDRAKALDLFKKACEGGFPGACSNLEAMNKNGEGISVDELQKACVNDDDIDACLSIASEYFLEEKYNTKTLKYSLKACQYEQGRGCYYVGFIYLMGGSDVPADKYSARKYFELSCKLSEPFGCSQMVSMCMTGQGGPTDFEGAKVYAEQTCVLGARQEICEEAKKMVSIISSTSSQQESDDPALSSFQGSTSTAQPDSSTTESPTTFSSEDYFSFMHHIDLNLSFPSVVFYSASAFGDSIAVNSDVPKLFINLGYAVSFSFDTNSIYIAEWLYLVSGFSARINLGFSDFNVGENKRVDFYKANLMQGIKINPVRWFYMTFYWNPYVSFANKAFDPKGAGFNLGFVVGGPFLIGMKAYFFHDSTSDLYTTGIDLNIGFSFLID